MRSVRAMVVATLAAYPAGGLLRVLGPDRLPVQLIGLLLMIGSLFGLALLAGTRLSRVTGEQPDRLDEYERNLRAGAMETAYALVVVVALVGVIYLALGSDFGWWIPTGYEQWSAVFWGLFLVASVLPTAVLAFRLAPDEDSGQ